MNNRKANVGQLNDIVVLDLTHMLSGPYGAMLLTDLGAMTIKVEPVSSGEKTRELLAKSADFSRCGMGAYFLTLNRGKKSIAIDLKDQEGIKIFYDLVRKADVVIDNYRAGVTKRLNIDHDSLRKINSRIVTCSITGFGETGPDTAKPAFDQIAQGMGGGMSITGTSDGPPVRAGIPIGDLGGGLFGALGILAALVERNITGEGQHLDISMLDCQISMLNYMATMYLMSGVIPERIGNSHFVHVPYDTFKTADGYIIIACIGDDFFIRLRDLLNLPELADPQFEEQRQRYKNKEYINKVLQDRLLEKTTQCWLDILGEAKIPCGPVNDLAQALSNPQVLMRDMVIEVELNDGEKVRMPGNPIKSSTHMGIGNVNAPPLLGENTMGVLKDMLGYSEDRIGCLRDRGVIG